MADERATVLGVREMKPSFTYAEWPIEKLRHYEKNPRRINKDDFERLKKQITKLGVYKPLLVKPDGTVLGGNMRLRAYKDLGIKTVPVAIVESKSEQTDLEYALSDNDRAGEYDDQALDELLHEIDIELPLFKVDLGPGTSLSDLMPTFDGGDDPSRLDEQDEVTCPDCGHKFVPKKDDNKAKD